jgi:O-antigen/teichoic acid export membrane protein
MATAVAGLRNIGVVAFRREMNYRQQFVLLSVPRLVQVAITIPLGLTLRSYWALVAGICISKVAEVAMSYLAHPYRPRLSLLGWRELASFSIWTWAASIASLLWNRCDPFVIGPAVGPAALGVYLLAAEIASLPVTELVAPATEVLYSGFSMAQKGGSDPLATALPASTILLLIVMPLTIAISATSCYIVAATLGPRWTDAQPLIAIAAWLGLFAPYSYVCATALVSAGRVRTIFVINSIASLLKLAGLSAVVAMTTDLPIIAAAGVAIVGSETLLFFVAIIRGDGPPVRDTLAGVARILVSTAVTFAAVAATGLAWSRVDMPAVQALAIGAALGIGAIAVFVASSFCVWHVSGRPAGPETRVVELLARMARPLRDRLAAAF